MRYPFPIPYGWFQLLWSHELALGEVRPLYYFGRHLVIWRDDEGTAHVQDAFCPHLGAHLGYGGIVKGCELECPFHGWTFDGAGSNTDIPYANRTNRKAALRTYPLIEVNGLIMAWYHPDDVEPMWEIPELAPFAGDDYSEATHRVYEINAHWQELAENGVDSAHFRYVHDTAVVPELTSYEYDGPFSSMRSKQVFVTPKGDTEGRIDTDSYGPGLSHVTFDGIVETHLMGCNTPIDAESCLMRFTFVVEEMGEITSAVGEGFVTEIDKQVQEDKPIWENKAFIPSPALATTDGPFMKFRKWAAQFYTSDLDQRPDGWEPERPSWSELAAFKARAKATQAAALGTRD